MTTKVRIYAPAGNAVSVSLIIAASGEATAAFMDAGDVRDFYVGDGLALRVDEVDQAPPPPATRVGCCIRDTVG